MTEAEKRRRRCCFTGHRPEKLFGSEEVIIAALESEIQRAISDGMHTFITGMAWGIDILAAEIVLRYRTIDPSLHLICAIPYPGFEKRMTVQWQQRYRAILDSADIVRIISHRQSRECYQRRNVWMVDRVARVIAVFNGEPGGTYNTIAYARRMGVETYVIDPRDL